MLQSAKKTNSLKSFIIDNKVYFYTISLAMLTWLILIISTHSVPFGNKSAIISDGLIEDYPSFTHLVDNIRNFRFTKVDYTLGYMTKGTTISSLLFFLNPLRIILLFFPTKYSLLGFNTLYGITFILTGPSMLFYLTHKPYGSKMDKHELKLIPIAMSYSLSSYVLCYMHFNGFLDMALFLPIIIYSMDRMVYKKKFGLYSMILGIYMILNNYYALLLCEFLIIYFLTMHHDSIRSFIRSAARFAFSSFLSAGIACFSLISFYFSVINGGYFASDNKAWHSLNPLTQNIIGSLQDFEVMHRINLVSSDRTAANSYSGLLAFLSLSLFIFIKNINLSERIRRTLVVFILYFSYGNELLNFVFHGFHMQTLVPNRFSIFFIFMMVIILYDVINNYKEIFSSKALISFLVLSSAVFFAILSDHHFNINSCIATIVFILIYLFTVFLGHSRKAYYKTTKFLLIFLAIELTLSTYETIRTYSVPSRDEMLTTEEILSAKQLSDKYTLKSDSMERTEIINTYNLNTAALININSTSLFSSAIQKEQIALSNTWNTACSSNSLSYNHGNPLADIMLNVSHFIVTGSSENDNVPSFYNLIDKNGTVALYENPYAVQFGILLPNDFIFESPTEYDNPFDYQNSISKRLIDKPLYISLDDKVSLSLKSQTTNDTSSNIYDGDGMTGGSEVVHNEITNSIIKVDVPRDVNCDLYLSADNSITFLGYATGTDACSFGAATLETDKGKIHVAYLDLNALKELSNYLKNYSESNSIEYSISDNSITYKYNSEDDMKLYIPLPAYPGWEIRVNSSNELYTCNDHNLGGLVIKLARTENVTKIIFSTNKDILSIVSYIISLISIFIYISIMLYTRQKIKKHRS